LAGFAIRLANVWTRLRERLFNAVGIVVLIVWFFASTVIATGPLGLKADRSNLGIVMLIFIAPAAVVVVIQELVHRIKFGPTKPGRHARGVLDLDSLSELDKGLRRGDGDTPTH
jgi:hypothetical protein